MDLLGADTHSIDNIRVNFILKELPLNICYRCPERVIKLAQDLVPEIEWNKDREDRGVLNVITRDELDNSIKSGDMVISRKNSVLVKLFVSLVLKQKRIVRFINNDIVKSILKDLVESIATYISRYNRSENIEVDLDEFMIKSEIPTNKKLRTKQEEKLVQDKVKQLIDYNKSCPKAIIKKDFSIAYLLDCMQEYRQYGSYKFVGNESYSQYEDDSSLAEYFDTIQEFINEYLIKRYNKSLEFCCEEDNKTLKTIKVEEFLDYLDEFLTAQCKGSYNCPILSSVHQMKGGEADRVFIVDYPNFPYYFGDKMTADDIQQEKNLQYVALTRAKKELTLVILNPDDARVPDKAVEKNKKFLQNIKTVFNEDELNITDSCNKFLRVNK